MRLKSTCGKTANVPNFHSIEKQSANQKAPIEPLGGNVVCLAGEPSQNQADLNHATSPKEPGRQHSKSTLSSSSSSSFISSTVSVVCLPLRRGMLGFQRLHGDGGGGSGGGWARGRDRVYPPAIWSCSNKCHDSRCISSRWGDVQRLPTGGARRTITVGGAVSPLTTRVFFHSCGKRHANCHRHWRHS